MDNIYGRQDLNIINDHNRKYVNEKDSRRHNLNNLSKFVMLVRECHLPNGIPLLYITL